MENSLLNEDTGMSVALLSQGHQQNVRIVIIQSSCCSSYTRCRQKVANDITKGLNIY